MTYEQIQDLKPDDCKHAGGVHPQTFDKMLQVLREHGQKKMKPGRPAKLALEDQLCMTLQYWREDRPYCHRGLSWGVAESVVGRTVQRIAHRLIKRPEVQVPGKNKWHAGGTPVAGIVVEVAESPSERPPKNSGATTAGRRSAPPRKPCSSSCQSPARRSGAPSGRAGSTILHCASGARAPERQRESVEQTKAITAESNGTATAKPRSSNPAVESCTSRRSHSIGTSRADASSASTS
jgi:Helix-turn-helix of DDE superfamily endonuclease